MIFLFIVQSSNCNGPPSNPHDVPQKVQNTSAYIELSLYINPFSFSYKHSCYVLIILWIRHESLTNELS